MTTEADIKSIISAIWAAGEPRRPDVMFISPVNLAMIDALEKFNGRDRRRIKREMRKAARKARGALS